MLKGIDCFVIFSNKNVVHINLVDINHKSGTHEKNYEFMPEKLNKQPGPYVKSIDLIRFK